LNSQLSFRRVKQPRQPGPTRGGTNATRGIGTHRVGLRIEIASPSINFVQKVRGADASIAVGTAVRSIKISRSGRGAEQPSSLDQKVVFAVSVSTRVNRWTRIRIASDNAKIVVQNGVVGRDYVRRTVRRKTEIRTSTAVSGSVVLCLFFYAHKRSTPNGHQGLSYGCGSPLRGKLRRLCANDAVVRLSTIYTLRSRPMPSLPFDGERVGLTVELIKR
jgi:hypothetical protein